MGTTPRKKLTEARTQRGWSQQDLAERIGSTAINVSRWERGITRPGPYFRSRLCELFDKSEQELDLGAEWDVSTAPSTSSKAVYDPAIPLQTAYGLVGRKHELKQLKQRLNTGGNLALTALNGLPGVGKTALAVELVHDPEVRARFQDGILWAGMGPNPNIPGLLSRWGGLLGLSPAEMASLTDTEAWALALHHALGTRSLLLVIDDAWGLEDALALKVGGPNCAHLVTTRLPNIASAIAADRTIVLHELDADEGLALLELLVPGIAVHEEQRAHELVKAVGGLPLALTLMGNYLRMQSYSGQTRRIDAALARLSNVEERLQIGEQRAPTERHPSLPASASLSLQSVFAVTDQQLDEQARTALYALSVLPSKPSSFSEKAALVVANCDASTLDTLFDAGLLESSSSGRYTIHQTVADYGRLHLQGATAYERLIAYCTDFAEAHTKDYEVLEQESDSIIAALEKAYELDKDAALLRCACALAPFLIMRGIYTVAERHLQRAYAVAIGLGDSVGITTTLLYLGEVSQYLGRLEQSEHYLQEGLKVARKVEDSDHICALLNDLGWVARKRGEYAQAEAYLQEGLMLARQLGDQKRICNLLTMLGSVVGIRGDLRREIEYQKEALSLARQLGEREEMCIILTNLGVSSAEMGEFSQAEQYFQEALSTSRQIGDPELTCGALCNLTELTQAKGEYAQAERYAREGLALARSIGHREWTAAIVGNLGLVYRSRGKYDQADTCFQEAVSIAREIDLPQLIATMLWEQSCLFLDTHQIEKADAALHELLAISPEGSQDLVALAQYGLAQVAAAQGDVSQARRLGEISLAALHAIGHRKAGEVQAWLATL